MSIRQRFILVFGLVTVPLFGLGQNLMCSPPLPSSTDSISIFFDAAGGNGELIGVDTIYAHTGLITNFSQHPNDWQYVQGVWGNKDPKVRMIPLGNNRHRLDIHIPSFYGIYPGTIISELAFVFRNADGSKVGRTVLQKDYKYPIASNTNSFQGRFIYQEGEFNGLYIGDSIKLVCVATANAKFTLSINEYIVDSAVGKNTIISNLQLQNGGKCKVKLSINYANQLFVDSLTIYVHKPHQEVPNGLKQGVNKINDSTITLVLFAPMKEYIHVINSESNFQKNNDNLMIRTSDSLFHWVTLHSGNDDYFLFQYLIEDEIRIGDPFSELVLDPIHDIYIDSTQLSSFPPYPHSLTTDIVSVHYNKEQYYNWKYPTINRVNKDDLVIYELLVRDFTDDHLYTTLRDTLKYIANLGVNAIEFMPFNEFEGNSSWGYNPSYQMALDKYYGTKNELKELIDSCHGLGIAVIMDQVFNHVYPQSPIAKLWWNDSLNAPSTSNPYLNSVCPHISTCWGLDFNQFVEPTQNYIDRINHYWINEFHVDGIRFDFTKGFTNNIFSNQIDFSRIQVLQRMVDSIWNIDTNFYVILEHWASNAEEKILADYGVLLWGNVTHQFQESAMGYHSNSDLTWGLATARGWNQNNLITYMESHDEERIAYKIKQYGNNSNSLYDIRSDSLRLERVLANSAIFYTSPGPKLLYMFSELGYDESINDPCRVCEKSINWHYNEDKNRKRLYYYTASLIDLRNSYDIFNSPNISHDLDESIKQISSNLPDSNFFVIANLGVTLDSVGVNLSHSGWWYNYFSLDSLYFGTNTSIKLLPGEWAIYTDFKAKQPKYFNRINGVPPPPANACIKCDSLNIGDFFLVDGDSIEVVDRTRLLAIVAAQGDLTKVCVSHVTDMKNILRGATWFNQDISRWDVSNVTNMNSMFFKNRKFNQDISAWDVSSVTNMLGMFSRCDSFNQNLNTWDVSNVTNMNRMFKEAVSFNGAISNWDVENVTRMTEMFSSASSFNQDISDWCVRAFQYQPPVNFALNSALVASHYPRWGNCPQDFDNVTSLATGTFVNNAGCVDCSALNIGDYFELGGDTLLVVDRAMLDSLILLHDDLSKVCVSNITDMKDALRGLRWFNTDIAYWDVSNVTEMSNMFFKAQIFNQDIGNWDVSSVTRMSAMFQVARSLIKTSPLGM